MSENQKNNLSIFSMDRRLSAFRKDRKTEDYLMLTITLGALIFFGVFVVRPSLILIFELNQKSKDYKSLSFKFEEKIKALEQIKSDNEGLKAEFALLQKAITDKPNESEILNNINYVASKNNIQISNIQFVFDEIPSVIKIKFNATGTYENTIVMFEEMKNLLTPININSVDINPEKEYGDNIVKLTIDAESYYLNK
ncbi:hypothetical protein CO058_02995 [candidate division WWE3 bacterium CG_4_9_14_0_2_um_filter_35_11]|uniref:Pilus assembly protein PilO n=1 Tax=candidate division WWE3 bacterium CG_4_9_14_0_2_um_filter_35_11 TaxID=1975077 RepID=A0A2M8ELD8_UNCKA|nr:MAG: hypothetical protein COV25_01925 [candidate division WWE3 bacterium CG10_big_fil_rev_8_21_14_0_10_35_32]PJC23549.1 MAG: hypothetical protein CO058_02995 [candidate division WWE3 bacterium CG_4_9_14_0_2_um_filter_35_11]